MNLRTITRGDAAVAGAALLLLIASFLPFYSVDGSTANAWHTEYFPLLPSAFLLGIIGAALILASRLTPQEPKPAGIQLSHWGTVLAVASFWSSLWSMLSGGTGVNLGVGAYLGFLATLALAGLAVATPMVPGLSAALVSNAPPAQTPGLYGQQGQPYPYQQQPGQHFQHGQPVQQATPGQPFTGPQAPYPGQQQPPAGYGYPQPQQGYGSPYGAPAAAAPAPAPAPAPAAEGRPSPAAPVTPEPTPQDAPPRQDNATALLTPVVKLPESAEPQGREPQSPEAPHSEALHSEPQTGQAAEPAAAEPQDAAAQAAGPSAEAPHAETPQPAAPQAAAHEESAAPAFAPFWFAVPAARPLYAEQGGGGAPVGELVPGTWYLAIQQRGDALLTQTQEGRRGLLTDTSGIQRG
ncbi:hypothetical protein [Streptacidiphilus sp. EB129]|uniref:hypothetical protein n=1 Tax=Streptacidiphilus sp. EB129 TaxID=3156262 RepID=UPI0035141DFE